MTDAQHAQNAAMSAVATETFYRPDQSVEVQQGNQRQHLLQSSDPEGFSIVDTECELNKTIQEHPYLISIQLMNPVGTAWWHICEGIRVSESFVLSTASCVWALRSDPTPTAFNGNLINSIYAAVSPNCRHQKGIQQIAIQKYYIYPDFVQPTMEQTVQLNDLALLQMNLSATQGPNTDQPGVTIGVGFEVEWSDLVGDEFKIIGYGQKNEADSAKAFFEPYYNNMLVHDVDSVKVISSKECSQQLNKLVGVNEDLLQGKVFCGLMVEGDICTGDYGAPLTVTGEGSGSYNVFGLFSWKPQNVLCNENENENENENQLVVFTNVTTYQKWIQGTIGKIENISNV